MSPETFRDPCVVPGIQPLLNELQQPVSVGVHGAHDPHRGPVEHFIRWVFLRSYGARLSSFYPTLLSFRTGEHLRAAVGFRDAVQGPTFAEQYLPAPAEVMIGSHWNQAVDRTQVVEVGNLALAGPGEARWLIAAVTTFLHACGYRWVLFTAVRPLFNAFQRLGLNPIQLGPADASRLPDGGRDWGSYYDERPVVCVGDIQSGHGKLSSFVSEHQPMLHALLNEAFNRASPQGCGFDTIMESAR
jgi:hypothetical protein